MRTLVIAVVLIATLKALGQNDSRRRSLEYPTAMIREERSIVVDGAQETWRLQWAAPPKLYCGADERDISLTCPCMGFAYGEVGDLYAVRLRDGVEIDRLRLTPLFGEHPAAVVQRWAADDERDFKLSQRDDFEVIVSKRPTVQVMRFADYDHDGKSTEFYLQTEAAPCGKSLGVVIGLSTDNPRLHAFGTVSNPQKPLYMQEREWEALHHASSVPVKVLDWTCGDHGSPTETDLELRWSTQGIDGVRREYTCPSKNETRSPISETPLGQTAP
jgi:hypothetical protein